MLGALLQEEFLLIGRGWAQNVLHEAFGTKVAARVWPTPAAPLAPVRPGLYSPPSSSLPVAAANHVRATSMPSRLAISVCEYGSGCNCLWQWQRVSHSAFRDQMRQQRRLQRRQAHRLDGQCMRLGHSEIGKLLELAQLAHTGTPGACGGV